MQSIIFFPLILLVCSLFNYFGDKYRIAKHNVLYFISFVIIVFIIGVRVNFGTDQYEYMNLYFNQKSLWLDPAYAFINKILFKYHSPYQILFLTICCLQFGILYKACIEFDIDVWLACEMSAIVREFEHSLALPFFGIGMKTDFF